MGSDSALKIPVLGIFGVGLIGGSLAISLKNRGAVGRVIGYGRSRENLESALEAGVIDQIEPDILKAAQESDVIVLATPVHTISDLLAAIAPAVRDNKIVTDVGSVKNGIVDAARVALGDSFDRFVPGHPVAGKEKSGIGAAVGDLFENHKVILTPAPETDRNACEAVQKMWEMTGASVISMNVGDHDRVLSVTSHLPHILAYVMMDFLSTSSDRERCYEMAAGGFYDFTRTASSDPEMWRDISLMNAPRLLADIEEYQNQLERVAGLIRSGDSQGIENLFASAKIARSRVTEKRKQRD